MANQEHLAILEKGVEEWNAWRNDNSAITVDLTGAALVGADLADLDLRGAVLEGTYLTGARLERVNLAGADLGAAQLPQADLFEANLHGCRLNSANLAGANLVHATLTATSLLAAVLEFADLRYANLANSEMDSTNLRAADLSNADLSGANIIDSNLSNANLQHANLASVRVTDTQLSHSDLSGAWLAGSEFTRSDLSGASLCGADLRGALIADSNLKNATLEDVFVGNTSFLLLNLQETAGLAAVHHLLPSTVAVDTLYLSRGTIPAAFLRGCGFDQRLIELLPSLVTSHAFEFFSCFISYSHEDKVFARRLHDQLQGRGIRCWLDEHQLKPGDRLLDVVDSAIRLHDKLVLSCSKASLTSWWVKDEIRKAQERERREKRDLIIPLNLDDYLFNWKDGLASDITSRLAADFTGWEKDNAKFEEQFERVVAALRAEADEESA